MTPAAWIALAYGLVAGVVVLYVAHLRRRLRRTRSGRGEETR